MLQPQKTQTPPVADNTQSLSLQQKYDYLTGLGTQALCLIHPEKGCTYLSKNFTDLTGHRAADCRGKGFFAIIDPESVERIQLTLQEDSRHTLPKTLHIKLQHADDSWQWYSCGIHQPDNKKSREYVCILENIHHHVQAQNTLQKAKVEAELALSTRSEFLANMSHDLRTPLNAVIGFAQIIEEQMFGQVNPQYLDYARHIQESGHDLLAKIEDLLEIACIDGGRATLDRKEVSLNAMLRQAIAGQSHHAVNADVLVEYAPPATGDVMLNVDRVKLQHCISHLVANAVKFSHRGGKVSLAAHKTEQNGIVLRIADHGIGMSDSRLQELKATLQQGSCWGVGGTCSIGLGLALTREFVVMHGGEVEISSAIGDGTTVDISLPEECVAVIATPLKKLTPVAG